MSFRSAAHAMPLLETLYLQNSVLEGADLLPGFSPADTVRSNGQGVVHAAPNGDFLGRVRTNPSQGATSSAAGVYYLFGSVGGADPVAVRREAMVAGIDQQSLNSPHVDFAGDVAYTALKDNNGLAGSGISGIWVNDTPIWYDEDMIPNGPLAGSFYGGPGGLHRSPLGVTSWVTSYTATAGGSAIGSALMQGTATNSVLLQSGDAIASLGTIAAESGAVSGNIEWSQLGTNYFTEVDLELGFTSTDEAPVLNGNAIFTASGAVIREGETIPVADGGTVGEIWESFFQWDVNEAGDYLFGAFTSDPSNDDVVVLNGEIIYREGQMLDGVLLSGQPQGMAINDLGDIAIAWNDTLFINDQKIAGPGDLNMVDTDGDGVGDSAIDGTGLSLNNIEITNLPATGGDGFPVVYVGGEASGGRDTMLRLIPAAPLDGDYNGDGTVDAADYTVWRDTLGSQFLLAADGDGDNIVDQDDYTVWANNFGSTLSPSVTVPEPSALVVVLCGSLLLTTVRQSTVR